MLYQFHALLYASIHTCCCCLWSRAYYSCISINMLTYGISNMTHLYCTVHTHTHAHMHLTHLIFVLSYFLLRSFVRVCSHFSFISDILFAFKIHHSKTVNTREKVFKIERKRMPFFRTLKWMPINFKCLWRAYFPASTHIFPYCDASHHQSQGEHRTHKKTSTRDHKMTDGQKVTICSV